MSPKLKAKISNTFRTLKQRNYRLFFIGQSISLTGSWIQNIAMSWLVYSLTQSAFMMGAITFVNALPSIVVSPIAGAIIDRVNKYKMLIALQSCFLLLALVLAVLTISGVIAIWQIIILGVLTNITAAFDMPLRQALVINLVDNPKDLSNAISLNSSNFNLARLLGPAIAGVLIGEFGEGICFLINATSYIAVIWALLLMNIHLPDNSSQVTRNLKKGIKEGIDYVRKFPAIKIILLFLAFVSFIGISYPLLMPIYADRVLLGDAKTLGILMSCSGVGALIASLLLASEKDSRRLPFWIYSGALVFGCSFMGLGFVNNQIIACLLLFTLGFGMIIGLISCNTLLQQMVDNDKRGRVMSLYTLAFIGTAPFGNLFGGYVAQRMGIANCFIFLGGLLIISALLVRFVAKKINFSEYIKN